MKSKTKQPRVEPVAPSLAEVDREESQEEKDRRMDAIWSGKPSIQKLIEIGELSGDEMCNAAFHHLRRVRWTLKQERERQGLSQEALAEKAGIDGPMLSRIESGKVFQPTIATLSRIADALGFEFTIGLKPREPKPVL